MRYIHLEITPEDKIVKEKRDKVKALVIQIQQANAVGDTEKVKELTAEANALNTATALICGDSEILRIMLDLFEVQGRPDNRIYCKLYGALENFESGFFPVSDEDYKWLLDKSEKMNLAEKFKDDKGNLQDKFTGPMKRGIGRIQEAIEKATTSEPTLQ